MSKQVQQTSRTTSCELTNSNAYFAAVLFLAAAWLLLPVPPQIQAQDASKKLTVKLTATLDAKGGVWIVAFRKHDKTLVSMSIGGDPPKFSIKQWDVSTGKDTRTFPFGQEQRLCAMALSPDGNTFAVGSDDGKKIELREFTTGKTSHTIDADGDDLVRLLFSADGKLLTSYGATKIRLWDVGRRMHIGTLTGHTSTINSVAISADGKTVASASTDGSARLWDVATGDNTKTLTFGGPNITTTSVAFSSDGKFLAVGMGRTKDNKLVGEVAVMDVATGKSIRTLTGHAKCVSSVAVRGDDKLIASADEDGKVKLWNATTGKELITLALHDGPVNSMTFSSDGKILASAGVNDKKIMLWDIPADAHSVPRLYLQMGK